MKLADTEVVVLKKSQKNTQPLSSKDEWLLVNKFGGRDRASSGLQLA